MSVAIPLALVSGNSSCKQNTTNQTKSKIQAQGIRFWKENVHNNMMDHAMQK